MFLVIAVWNSTEIISPLHHVRLTTNRSDITLSPFPYDVSGVSVSLSTSEESCLWLVNNRVRRLYISISIRPDKLDLLFLISHFLDLGAGGQLLFITSLFYLISDFLWL